MRALLIIAALSLLTACASQSNSESVTATRDGNTITGTAGVNWSNGDLEENRFGAVCGGAGEKVGTIDIGPRNANGAAKFTATCVK